MLSTCSSISLAVVFEWPELLAFAPLGNIIPLVVFAIFLTISACSKDNSEKLPVTGIPDFSYAVVKVLLKQELIFSWNEYQ